MSIDQNIAVINPIHALKLAFFSFTCPSSVVTNCGLIIDDMTDMMNISVDAIATNETMNFNMPKSIIGVHLSLHKSYLQKLLRPFA